MMTNLAVLGLLSLFTTFSAVLLAVVGGLLVVARGRAYAGMVVGALLLLGAIGMHAFPSLTDATMGLVPYWLTDASRSALVRTGVHITESIVLGLAWVAILVPVLRPDEHRSDLDQSMDHEMGA